MLRRKKRSVRVRTLFAVRGARRYTSTTVHTPRPKQVRVNRREPMTDRQQLIYDWNLVGRPQPLTTKPVLLNDETLRDGLQSPTVCDPVIEDKIRLLHLMEDLGIQMLDIGLPGAGPRAYEDVLALAKEIGSCHLKIRPNCAARTTVQ